MAGNGAAYAPCGCRIDDDRPSSMQSFIRSQMYSIMHPVSEHVRELQAQLQQLAKRITGTDSKIDETRLCMDQQHSEVFALRKALTQTDSHLERLQNDLGSSYRMKEKLGADHEVTKSDLSKIAGDFRSTNVMVKAMQQKCEDLESEIRALYAGTAKMGQTLAAEAEKSARVKELTECLNARHCDMAKDIDALARAGAAYNHGLHRLHQDHGKASGVVRAELAQQQEHLHSLESRLGSAQQDIHVNKDSVRGIDARLRGLKPNSEHVDLGPHHRQTVGRMESPRVRGPDVDRGAEVSIKAHTDTMDTLKVAVNKLQELFSQYKESHAGLIKDLDRRIGENTHHVDVLMSAKESMGEHLRKHDAVLTKVQRTLDAVGGHVDHLQGDCKGMLSAQKDLNNRVEAQRIALTKAQADLKNTDACVDSTNENLRQLKDGVTAMDVSVAKLGSRYDVCKRDLHGVSRGLADVSKHVSQGDHGLLSPKSFHHSELVDFSSSIHRPLQVHLNDTHSTLSGSLTPPSPASPARPRSTPLSSRRTHCLHFRNG